MRALIGPDLLRTLTPRNLDIRDQTLNGYVLRCRASGTHSYLVTLGRGRWTTIGRVGDIGPETARLAAESLLSGVVGWAVDVNDRLVEAIRERYELPDTLSVHLPTR